MGTLPARVIARSFHQAAWSPDPLHHHEHHQILRSRHLSDSFIHQIHQYQWKVYFKSFCMTLCSASYRGWSALRFPTPKLRFPPLKLCWLYYILHITFPPQWHQVLHLRNTSMKYWPRLLMVPYRYPVWKSPRLYHETAQITTDYKCISAYDIGGHSQEILRSSSVWHAAEIHVCVRKLHTVINSWRWWQDKTVKKLYLALFCSTSLILQLTTQQKFICSFVFCH